MLCKDAMGDNETFLHLKKIHHEEQETVTVLKEKKQGAETYAQRCIPLLVAIIFE